MPVLAFELDDPDSLAVLARLRTVADEAAALLGGPPRAALDAAGLARASERLGRLDPSLALERITDDASGPALLVTCGEERACRPLADRVAELLGRRLAIPIAARRPAAAWARVAGQLEALGIDASAARVRAVLARGHLIELVVSVPSVHAEVDDETAELFEEIVRRALGERLHDDWVGSVRVVALRRRPLPVVGAPPEPETQPLEHVAALVRRGAEAVRAGLPTEPRRRSATAADWALLEVEASDGADGEVPCADLVLASSCVPEAVRCFLAGGPFSSVRFSLTGESFAYVTAPRERGTADRALAARDATSEAVDAALEPADLGAVIGTGIGVESSYLFLALRELAVSVPLVRGALRGHVGGDLRFCDDDLAREVVPLGPPGRRWRPA